MTRKKSWWDSEPTVERVLVVFLATVGLCCIGFVFIDVLTNAVSDVRPSSNWVCVEEGIEEWYPDYVMIPYESIRGEPACDLACKRGLSSCPPSVINNTNWDDYCGANEMSVCLIEGYDCTDVDAFGTTSTQCERYRDAETEAECIEEKITESTSYERCPCREGAEHGHCPCNVEMVVIIRVAEHNLICGDKVYDVSAEGGIRPFNEGVK